MHSRPWFVLSYQPFLEAAWCVAGEAGLKRNHQHHHFGVAIIEPGSENLDASRPMVENGQHVVAHNAALFTERNRVICKVQGDRVARDGITPACLPSGSADGEWGRAKVSLSGIFRSKVVIKLRYQGWG